MKAEHIRRVRFTPYQVGMGPTFILDVFDLNKQNRDGKYKVGYILTLSSPDCPHEVFRGTMYIGYGKAVDGDDVVKSAMTFCTLRPGDTDRDHFVDYTEAQMHFVSHHAEVLSLYGSEGMWDEEDGSHATWEAN